MTNFISNRNKTNDENNYHQKSDNKITFNSNGDAKDSISKQYNYTLTWKKQIITSRNDNE